MTALLCIRIIPYYAYIVGPELQLKTQLNPAALYLILNKETVSS
jgi:hypothetical protein